MRHIKAGYITENVAKMCMEANYHLTGDMEAAIGKAHRCEESPVGRNIMGQLAENLKIAADEKFPICQDTGMTVIFVKLGQNVVVEGGNLTQAINEGVRRGYGEGYLRKSVVGDPVQRKNTNDNTPAIIHYDIVEGANIEITVVPKGAGSENVSRIYMLKPSDGIDGISRAVLDTVRDAGPNACPPLVVGVGIGGNFEKCAELSKMALTRDLGKKSPLKWVCELEDQLLEDINAMGIGPAGLGGTITALAVNAEVFPTHIAMLPVAVNICCHANRHARRVL